MMLTQINRDIVLAENVRSKFLNFVRCSYKEYPFLAATNIFEISSILDKIEIS